MNFSRLIYRNDIALISTKEKESAQGPKKNLVTIVMGSASDLSIMQEGAKIFDELKIPYNIRILSAHRSPEATALFSKEAEEKGVEVIIVGAGGAAHLAGVIASHTVLPVVSVPMETSPLGGLDSLYSIVQMPSGVPVATMAIGKAGAKNAAIMAAIILGGHFPEIRDSVRNFKENLVKKVLAEDALVQEIGYKEFLNRQQKES
jgi:5-(carboxyamino)imidazole ribonucleotide mutase